jgi:hypothetical protein
MCPFTVMPWAPLALTVLFVGLATVAAWLLDTGWRRRSAWRSVRRSQATWWPW